MAIVGVSPAGFNGANVGDIADITLALSVLPLTAFVAFMIGATLFGIVGALMAIPAAAVMQVAFEEAFVARRERRQDLARAGTLRKRAG